MHAVNRHGLNLMTWNTRGMHHPIKKKKVMSFIKSQKCDFVIMQETHLMQEEAQKLGLGGPCFRLMWEYTSRGVITSINKQLQFKCLEEVSDNAGRFLLLLGRALQDICKDSGFVDVCRPLHPSTRDYTFYSSPHGTLSRLDYFLISKSVTFSAASSTIGNILISDHAPVFLSMLPFNKTAHTPRWRLNSSLLLDLDFKESLRAQINLFKETNLPSAPSAGTIWEVLKAFTRGPYYTACILEKKG